MLVFVDDEENVMATASGQVIHKNEDLYFLSINGSESIRLPLEDQLRLGIALINNVKQKSKGTTNIV